MAPAKPIDIKNRYEPLDIAADKSFVVPIAEFIVESTRKMKNKQT